MKRLDWIDQARGLSIFLVVYGHNFPANEPYIYSFHVPLFFFIAGIFHPQRVRLDTIKKRAKMILVPYFIWAALLFLFWVIVGRNYGKSNSEDLSVLDNFMGIFYAQGGQTYMDWGIPMWFLPCIFLLFLIFSLLQKIKKTLSAPLTGDYNDRYWFCVAAYCGDTSSMESGCGFGGAIILCRGQGS